MKTHLRNYATSALLLLPASFALLALPASVQAQTAAPEIRSLDVEADAGLRPGSRLTFRLVGTPRANANVRIRGLRENVELNETAPGVYLGRYTVQRDDQIALDTGLRAMMRNGNRSAVAEYELGQVLPRALPQPRIDRFGMVPVERLDPGTELRFALDGMPGARVSIDLPGVERDFLLAETQPGHYEGSYTIRRNDDIPRNRPVVATMRVGERVVKSEMELLVAKGGRDGGRHEHDGRDGGHDARDGHRDGQFGSGPGRNADRQAPHLTFLVPAEGATVPAGPSVNVSATFEDGSGTGVDPGSVQILISGRNVTRDAKINAQSFTYWGAVPPGRHVVDVTARDRAGNALHKAWSFDVGAVALQRVEPPRPLVRGPADLAVQFLNRTPNEQIGTDPLLIRGRTAPMATVIVNVQAIAPAGQPENYNRTVFAQTLQADREGEFRFTMVPGIPVPGIRYDISVVASRDGRSRETRMSLIQQ